MKTSFKKGISFGLTSAVITTLGLLVGLNSSTGSRLAIISGILIIAIADAFSDALGIHVSEESNERNSSRHVWEATLVTFLSKLIFALTFIIPFLFFDLTLSTFVAIAWGMFLLVFLSYKIGKKGSKIPWEVILEHLTIAIVVIFASYYLGKLISILLV